MIDLGLLTFCLQNFKAGKNNNVLHSPLDIKTMFNFQFAYVILNFKLLIKKTNVNLACGCAVYHALFKGLT